MKRIMRSVLVIALTWGTVEQAIPPQPSENLLRRTVRLIQTLDNRFNDIIHEYAFLTGALSWGTLGLCYGYLYQSMQPLGPLQDSPFSFGCCCAMISGLVGGALYHAIRKDPQESEKADPQLPLSFFSSLKTSRIPARR